MEPWAAYMKSIRRLIFMKNFENKIIITVGVIFILLIVIGLYKTRYVHGEFKVIGHFDNPSGIYGWEESMTEMYSPETGLLIFRTNGGSLNIGSAESRVIEIRFDEDGQGIPEYSIVYLNNVDLIRINGREIVIH
jgi:hypothetical protein